ncbi:MAG: hypothetical protein ACPGYL_03515, partial [Rhodospirillaceae bacterium]
YLRWTEELAAEISAWRTNWKYFEIIQIIEKCLQEKPLDEKTERALIQRLKEPWDDNVFSDIAHLHSDISTMIDEARQGTTRNIIKLKEIKGYLTDQDKKERTLEQTAIVLANLSGDISRKNFLELGCWALDGETWSETVWEDVSRSTKDGHANAQSKPVVRTTSSVEEWERQLDSIVERVHLRYQVKNSKRLIVPLYPSLRPLITQYLSERCPAHVTRIAQCFVKSRSFWEVSPLNLGSCHIFAAAAAFDQETFDAAGIPHLLEGFTLAYEDTFEQIGLPSLAIASPLIEELEQFATRISEVLLKYGEIVAWRDLSNVIERLASRPIQRSNPRDLITGLILDFALIEVCQKLDKSWSAIASRLLHGTPDNVLDMLGTGYALIHLRRKLQIQDKGLIADILDQVNINPAAHSHQTTQGTSATQQEILDSEGSKFEDKDHITEEETQITPDLADSKTANDNGLSPETIGNDAITSAAEAKEPTQEHPNDPLVSQSAPDVDPTQTLPEASTQASAQSPAEEGTGAAEKTNNDVPDGGLGSQETEHNAALAQKNADTLERTLYNQSTLDGKFPMILGTLTTLASLSKEKTDRGSPTHKAVLASIGVYNWLELQVFSEEPYRKDDFGRRNSPDIAEWYLGSRHTCESLTRFLLAPMADPIVRFGLPVQDTYRFILRIALNGTLRANPQVPAEILVSLWESGITFLCLQFARGRMKVDHDAPVTLLKMEDNFQESLVKADKDNTPKYILNIKYLTELFDHSELPSSTHGEKSGVWLYSNFSKWFFELFIDSLPLHWILVSTGINAKPKDKTDRRARANAEAIRRCLDHITLALDGPGSDQRSAALIDHWRMLRDLFTHMAKRVRRLPLPPGEEQDEAKALSAAMALKADKVNRLIAGLERRLSPQETGQ